MLPPTVSAIECTHRVSSLHFCGGEQHNIYLKDGPVARALGLIWSVTVGAGRCVFFSFFFFFHAGVG